MRQTSMGVEPTQSGKGVVRMRFKQAGQGFSDGEWDRSERIQISRTLFGPKKCRATAKVSIRPSVSGEYQRVLPPARALIRRLPVVGHRNKLPPNESYLSIIAQTNKNQGGRNLNLIGRPRSLFRLNIFRSQSSLQRRGQAFGVLPIKFNKLFFSCGGSSFKTSG